MHSIANPLQKVNILQFWEEKEDGKKTQKTNERDRSSSHHFTYSKKVLRREHKERNVA